MNSFFSGSFKTYSSYIWLYPANSAVLFNGTVVDPNFNINNFNLMDLSYGVKGYVEPE
jgi:hypothetical protein